MTKALSKDIANELRGLLTRLDVTQDRLDRAIDLLHLWTEYMEGGLTLTEKELIHKTEEFLGDI